MVNGKCAQNSAQPSCTFANRPKTCGSDSVIHSIDKAVERFLVF